MIVVSLIFFMLAGIAEGIMDTLQFRFYKSVFKSQDQMFWNPDLSWQNKWKQGDPKFGPKFFGASTFLVFTTDAWHLFKWTRNRMIDLGIYSLVYDIEYSWLIVIIFAVGRSMLFEYTFRNLSK